MDNKSRITNLIKKTSNPVTMVAMAAAAIAVSSCDSTCSGKNPCQAQCGCMMHKCGGKMNPCAATNPCAGMKKHHKSGKMKKHHRAGKMMHKCGGKMMHKCGGKMMHKCGGKMMHKCGGKMNPCAGKMNPCAGKMNPCAGKK